MLRDKSAIAIELHIPLILSIYGFKRKRDYVLGNGQLYIKNVVKKNKIAAVLQSFYPTKHYYWEAPRILRWF